MSEGYSSSKTTRWEYIRTQADANNIKESDATLDKLGRDGWELVDVTYTDSYVHMWFKRPK